MRKEILKLFFKPLRWINQFLPKNDKQIFLYANLGFRDNVLAFYDYLISRRYNEVYRIICSSDDYEVYKDSAPPNVSFISSKSGIKHFLRSKYVFYCFGKYPIKPAPDQTVVNLWHGIPLKRIGNMEEENRHVDYNYFTYLLATSEFYADIMKQSFNCGSDQILICGQPKTDDLFGEDSDERQYQKVIVWFPTYRNMEKSENCDENRWPVPLISLDEASKLNEMLKHQNCKLIIKLHPLQYCENNLSFTNISLKTQKDMLKSYKNVYHLLRLADALITDYSSIYFDYLLLDRPIGFTVDDIENYKQSRGFVFDDPLAYMPGSHIHTLQELLTFIENVIEGTDAYKVQREKINKLVNQYQDGNNSQRIAQFVFKEEAR